MQRLACLDIARGLAIFFMIFIETTDYTSRFFSVVHNDLQIAMLFLIGPMLFLVSGASMYFWFQRIKEKPGAWSKVLKRTSLLLFGLWIVCFLSGFYYRWASWELLPALGVFTFLLWCLNAAPAKHFLWLGIAVFLIALPLQWLVGIQDFWVGHYKYYVGSPVEEQFGSAKNPALILYGMVVTAAYPIFPYFGYVLFGYWFGKTLEDMQKTTDDRLKQRIQKFCLLSIFVGFGLLLVNHLFLDNSWWLRYDHFPSTLPAELIYLGSNILIMLAIYSVYDQKKRPLKIISNFFYTIGQNAIYIYICAAFSIYSIVKIGTFIKQTPPQWGLEHLMTFPAFWMDSSVSFTFFRDLISIPHAFVLGFVMNLVFFAIFSKKRYKPGERLGKHGARKFFH